MQGKSTESSRIDGFVSDGDITDHFAGHFQKVFGGNDEQCEARLRDEFQRGFTTFQNDHINDSISPYLISFSEFTTAVSKLKLDKTTSTFVKAEHIFHESPKLLVHLHMLYNGLIQHGYVPQDFLNGAYCDG